MVLSFGGMGDETEDDLEGFATPGSDPFGLLSHTTPQSTAPLSMIGPTTPYSTGSLYTAPSSGSGIGDFFSTLGKSLLGTTAAVTAQRIVGNQSPAQMAAAKAQADAAAAASRNSFLMIGGIVLAVVVVGGLALRRRAAA
jgi:hypothetical protein